MKVYTVERMNKYDYDFSVKIRKEGCYSDKNKALERAKKVYESMCSEYEDDMLRDSVEEDPEYGYYAISFGYDEDYEFHSVAVEEWEMED